MRSRPVLIEFDKSGAEWVCVAYLTGDGNMLSVVEDGRDPHTVTGAFISGMSEELVIKEHKAVGGNTDPETIVQIRKAIPEFMMPHDKWFFPRSMSVRQCGKKSNHGLNYDMKYRRFALENEIEESEAKRIVNGYKVRAYPGLTLWHESIQKQLRDNRTLVNCFGRKRKFMDAWGPELFDAAYSFIPQSTVFDICREGMIKTYDDERAIVKDSELLMHTHDSNTYQYPTDSVLDVARFCDVVANQHMNPKCHYNGRDFYINTTMKMGYSLGEMKEFEPTPESVEETLEWLREN